MSAPTKASRAPCRIAWVLLSVIILAEFVLFDQFGSKRVTSIYPRWNDQIQYLSDGYTAYEYARNHGIGAGLWRTLINPSAQGTLHDFAALLLFEVAGPFRSTALALNMLALIAWQAALYFAVSRRCRSCWLGLAAAMLPLTLYGPWLNVPGSAYDFRLDHLAMCMIGVASAIAFLTDGLRHRGWSIFFGIAVALALLTRFLTGTYFVLIFGGLGVRALLARDRKKRLLNLSFTAAAVLITAGPILWLNRQELWNYYYIGHYVGPESAIRNQNFGLGRSFSYVFGWLGQRHLGSFFGLFVALGAIGIGLGRLVQRGAATSTGETDPNQSSRKAALGRDTVFFGLLFLLAPALVLILHPQKSEVVIGALAPGVILLAVALWLYVGWTCLTLGTSMAVGSIAAVVAVISFGRTQTSRFEEAELLANLRQVNAEADYIFDVCGRTKIERPRVAVDYITDAFDAQVLRVVCYERHHVWKDFDMRLPTGIAKPDVEVVRQRIADSDFVFLTDDATTSGPFPFDHTLAQLRAELRSWCQSHLVEVRHFTFLGRPLVLYQRPELPLPSAP